MISIENTGKQVDELSKPARRSVWKHTPQRSRLRRALFQIHLWIGVVLALYAVVIGLTGSVLVFSEEIETYLEPHLHLVTPGESTAPLQTVWKQIEATHPAYRVLSLELAEDSDHASQFFLAKKQGPLDRSAILNVYVNPYTGHILGEHTTVQGPLGWARNLHYFLLAGETGVIVNGWMGLALLVLCITGAVIWWPGILRWKRSLSVSWSNNWKRLNWDLHSAVGFWCCASLLVVSFTGVYFTFPMVVGGLTLIATHSDIKQTVALMQPSKALPHDGNAVTISLDKVISKAKAELPPGSPLSFVQLPASPDAVFTAIQYRQRVAPYSQMTSFDIDPYTGKVLRHFDTAQYPVGMRIVQYYHSIHFGSFAGKGAAGRAVQCLWVVLGLAPAILAVTGLIMYWNRYLSHFYLKSYDKPEGI
jgi:uncharacterized iron-regulated membrane protein